MEETTKQENIIPQEVMQELKRLELIVNSTQKDLQIAQLNYRVAILQLFVDYKLPHDAELKADGSWFTPVTPEKPAE